MENQIVERKPYESPELRFEDSVASKVNAANDPGSSDILTGDGFAPSP